MYQNLIYKKESSLAILQLNRPQKKNSLNTEMRHEIEATLKEIAEDPKQKVVILTGGEDFFCAGADISEIQDASTAEETYKHSREFQLLFDQIETLPQPVIAAVAGYALGGGCEMTLACSLGIASST